ncbi:MAG TPA: DUF3445 domain-containing protein [Geminicoccaceae bacterium]|nr:DUF3445 domain-containing protein [Geminicoccaceae bacterium]
MRLPLVFMDGPYRPTMGLRNLDLADWLWLDERLAADVTERRRLVQERPDEVLAVRPGAEPACRELLEMLVAWLPRHAPAHYAAAGEALLVRATGDRVSAEDREPLRRAGLLVQEDLCLMGRGADGAYRLEAAHLCFPSHWRLHDKLGRPLREIHAPVPVVRDRLAEPIDRFFATLAPERPVWRANWSLVESPAPFHPGPRVPDPLLSADNAGERLWLRVERQTLRRLPVSGFVLFTIRTLIRPLGEVARQEGVAVAMAARLREMPEAMARYKGLPLMAGPVLGFLDRVAAGGSVAPAPQHP